MTEETKQLIKTLAQEEYGTTDVYLVGSQVDGTADEFSDWDIVFVGLSPKDVDLRKLRRDAFNLSQQSGIMIHIMVKPQDKFIYDNSIKL